MNGDVRLRVEGLMLERLIQRALNEGCTFRRIRRESPRALILDADPAGADILSGLCERFSLPCEVLSRRGRDAVRHRLKQRATLLAGIVACLAVVSLFLSRIWLIDIQLTGNRTADTRPLEAALDDLGVRPGMAKSGLNSDLLESALSAGTSDFSFVGVRLQGVRLLVEASAAVPEPELYQLDSGRDLVAECDGVVLSVNVLSGEACVRPGDTIVRGQVLIRGDERITKEETRGIAALGSVVARTWHTGTAAAPSFRTENRRTGVRSASAELRLLDFAWTLLEGESYPSQETELEILPVGGLFLPLEIRRTTRWQTGEHLIPLDEASLRSSLSALAFAEAAAHMTQAHPDGCTIADRWIEYTLDAQGVMHARAVYETHTDVAVTRDALYQQGG